jgi:CheY-like chemotaxis protein
MRRECPVVAVTAFTDKSVKNKALQLGMRDIIYKPVSLQVLKEVVERLFFFEK